VKRGLLIAGGIVVGILLVVGLGAAWLLAPAEVKAFHEPGPSFEARHRGGLVEAGLELVGVTDVLYAESDGLAYVGYNVPANATATVDEMQTAALVALASANPDAKTGIAVLHESDVAKLEWKADLDALRAAVEDATKLEAWLASIEKKTI